jgi:hypothetical protein
VIGLFAIKTKFDRPTKFWNPDFYEWLINQGMRDNEQVNVSIKTSVQKLGATEKA